MTGARLTTMGSLVLMLGLPCPAALAEESAETEDTAAEGGCADVEVVDDFQWMRQLTLDLYGRIPSVAELEPLTEGNAIDEALVDELLASEELDVFLDRHHKDLLWPSLDQFELVNPALALLLPALYYEYEGGGAYTENPMRLFVLYVGLYGRGGLVPCKDEPAEYDDYGNLVFEAWPDGTQREGWVEVEPYWAPGTTVKVCALEARTLELPEMALYTEYYNPQAPCDSYEGMATGGCGCGPNLEHCMSIEAGEQIGRSLRDQLLYHVKTPIAEGRSYFDMLTDKREPLDGPLIHYYKHLIQMAVDPIIYLPPIAGELLPDRLFGDLEWELYERGETHAGLLTSLMYLLRFQTSRARANRYYDAFLCSPFQAPGLDLPSPSDPCSQEPNLRKRCGCMGCHQTLEPATGHWARFADAGALYLDPSLAPPWRADCATCAQNGTCDFLCQRFYLTEAGHPDEEQWVGTLMSLMWREPAEMANVAGGPSLLVEQHLEGGQLALCASRKVFERLHGREMTLPEQISIGKEAAAVFEDSGYDFLSLIKHWLMSDSYRRMVR